MHGTGRYSVMQFEGPEAICSGLLSKLDDVLFNCCIIILGHISVILVNKLGKNVHDTVL